MKNLFKRSNPLTLALGIAAVGCLLSISIARADETWDGGDGQWDANNTANWNGGNQWIESYDATLEATDPGTGTVTNPGIQADFTTTGGTVNVVDSPVSNSVAADNLYFNGGAFTLTGDPIYTTGGFNGNIINVDNSSAAVTIDSEIDHNNSAANYASGSFPGDNQHILNSSAHDLTLNGTLNYDNQTTLFVDASGAGKIIFNNTVNAFTSGLYTGGGGTIEFTADSDMSNIDSAKNGSNLSLVAGGNTILLDADTFAATSNFEILGSSSILLNSSFVGTQLIQDEANSLNLGGNQAVSSGWSGGIYFDNNPPTQTLSQVAGGRFTYSGDMHGNNATYVITSGDGTVVLNSASTYTGNNTLAADLQAKTTLITNPTLGTSAFGNNTGVVQLEAGKTLGGTGYSTQQIVAMDNTSVITAGDPGDPTLGISASVGTLHLLGGLTTTDDKGLTFDFKLDGANNDKIDLPGEAATLTLNGQINVNFTVLAGGVQTGTPYELMFADIDGGTWTGGTDFNVVAPTGYALDKSYFGTGYLYDTAGDEFSVQFVEAPEPSTYALTGLGVLALVAFARFRKQTA